MYTIQELKDTISPLARTYGVKSVSLFGSYARGDAERQSDIDLMVIGGERFQPTDIFCIAEDLYRTLGKDVDVYEQREINADTEFYRTIFREGVKIE